MEEFIIRPNPSDPRLTQRVTGIDQTGAPIETSVTVERPLTLFLNGQEIVTMMTICDYPEYLALGYLLNQNMLRTDDRVTDIVYDDEIETVVVRTERPTDYEQKLKKKTLTSGCAQGTVFGDLMEKFEVVRLSSTARIKTSWLATLTRKINTAPSLYLKPAPSTAACWRARRQAAGLYGGCRPAQRGRQDRRLHVPARAVAGTTRSSTPPAG